jgi:CubicO group peptidase (beta-lactamase class C family)
MQTAVAVLQQVEAGGLDLEAPITETLAGLEFEGHPEWAPSITSRHLLSHASAMYDYVVMDGATGDEALGDFAYGPFGSVVYLMAPSGRMYNYSNPNFYVAGLVAESLAGEAYREYMRDHVWLPLGMDRTFLLPAEVIADGDYVITTTASPGFSGPLAPDAYDAGAMRPAGFAFSSVLQLAEFVKFLRNGNTDVLSDGLRTDMQSPQMNTKMLLDLYHYGFGIFLAEGFWIGEDFYDVPLLTHNGYIPGHCADLTWVPGLDFGFITLATGDQGYFPEVLAEAMLHLCELPEPAAAPDLTVDPDTFTKYAGDYHDPNMAGTITITKRGDQLQISVPLFDTNNIPYNEFLQAASPDNFLFIVQSYPLGLTFILDEGGQPEYLRTRSFVAERLKDRAGPGTLPAPGLDPGELSRRLRFSEPPPWTSLMPPPAGR